MQATAVFEFALIGLQHLAAIIFIMAASEAFSHMLSLPRGPMGRVFRAFALGSTIFAAMAIAWSLEDAVPVLDQVTDMMFIVALAVTMWGSMSLLALKLLVED